MTATPRRPVTKTIGSVTFNDDYDWLQHETEEAHDWMWAQDAHAQEVARGWEHFETLREQIRANDAGAFATSRTAPRLLGGRWFWLAPTSEGTGRVVWSAESATDAGAPIFDLADHLAPEDHADAAVLWYEPSPDGRRVAAVISIRGDLIGQWHIFDAATGRAVREPIPAMGYSGALPGWLPDASGFYLHGRDAEGRHQISFTPLDDGVGPRPDVVFDFADVPVSVSGLILEVSPDGRRIITIGSPHERVAYMIGDTETGEWRRFIPPHYEGEVSGGWLDNDTYVARAHSVEFPRGRIVAIPVATSQDIETWREIVPQGKSALRALTVVGGKIALADLLDVSLRFRVLDIDGANERAVPVTGPGNSWLGMFRKFDRSEALSFDYASFTQSSGIYNYDVHTGELSVISAPEVRMDGISVTQHFAQSLDGVQIPYFLIHRSDLSFEQPRPAVITGYGGFNSAFAPTFLSHYGPFVQAGGVLIHTNIRGGGEYGKMWHEGGRLACKWNSYLDFFAIAEQAIAQGITRADKLAMTGASNGGLLAGICIAHRPDLFRVVVPDVPIFDMMESLPNEPQAAPIKAIFLEDYGDPEDAVMSRVIYSYSPYHNVRDGIAYPAVFQVFGEKDESCRPYHGRKFTARLQQADVSGRPILLRVWKNTAHAPLDAETSVLQRTEWLGFVMSELGMVPVRS